MMLFGHDELYINHAKLNKSVGLPIHMISELLKFMKGKFTKIQKKRDGQVLLEFTLPFNHMKSNSHQKASSPLMRGNCKREVVDGNIVICSPLSGFKKGKTNSDIKKSRISSIRETIRQVDSMTNNNMDSMRR